MAVGGDITEVTYNHPTIGSGTLFIKANEDSTFEPGGFRSNDDANGVTGSGEMIDQMNRVRSGFEVTVAWDMNTRNDIENVVLMVGSPVLADWTVTHINGTVWGGKGKPVGDISGNANNATFVLKVAGGGNFSKIL